MEVSLYTENELKDIVALYVEAFSKSEGENEGLVIGELAKALLETTPSQDIYCFVAKQHQQVIGVIIFSRMTFEEPLQSFILSPVAVASVSQKQGVGQQLITEGIEYLKKQGVTLVFTYGDPAYYSKVGFDVITERQIKAPQPLSFPHGWLAQSLSGDDIPILTGDSVCVAALNKAEYW